LNIQELIRKIERTKKEKRKGIILKESRFRLSLFIILFIQ
jgi:hypothetical protein